MTVGLAGWIVRHPRTILAISAAAALACVLGLRRLSIDPDIASLYPPDDPTLRLTRALQGDAGPARTLIVVLRAGRAETIDAVLPAVAARLRASPCVTRVIATRAEFAGERRAWIAASPLHFVSEDALGRLKARIAGPERQTQLQSLRNRIAEDPLSGKRLALADPLDVRWILASATEELAGPGPARYRSGSPYLVLEEPPLAFLRVIGAKPASDTAFSASLIEDVRVRLAESLQGRATTELAGSYVTASYQSAAMRTDLRMQILSSSVLVILFLTWFTRSFVAPHAMALPIALAIAATLAIGGQIFGPLTPLVVAVCACMIGEGIDYPVHLFARYRQERRSRDRDAALQATLRALGRPFLGAAATTVMPLLVLLWSRYPGMIQFGTMLAIGLALSVVVTLTLMVPLLRGIDRFKMVADFPQPLAVRGANWVYSSGARWPVAALLLVAGVGAWSMVAARGVRFELDLRNSMAQDDPGIAALDRLERDLGFSITPVIGLVDACTPVEDLRAACAGGAAAFMDGPHELFPSPEARARVERLQSETRTWVADTLAALSGLGYTSEPFREGLEELNDMISRPAPSPETLDRDEFAATRSAFQHKDGTQGSWVLYFFPRRALWRPADRAPFDADLRARFGPGLRLFSAYHLPDHHEKALASELRVIVAWSCAGVVLLTVLSIGELRLGLLALIPVLVATGVTLAMCTVMGGVINLFSMAGLPIVVGVGVDYGIYFASHLREGGRDPGACLKDVGPAVWGTTATTILGFGPIGFSRSPGLTTLGILVMTGMCAAFAATILLLPALAGKLALTRPTRHA